MLCSLKDYTNKKKLLKFVLFLLMHICVRLCEDVCTRVYVHTVEEEGVRSLRAGVTGRSGLLDINPGNQIQVLWKSSK